MRDEQAVFALILMVAKNDERIRAVLLNGSRANPAAPKDCYRDYDIVFAVTETAPFIEDRSWLGVFGKTAMVQEPDSKYFGWGAAADFSRSYAWLMLFDDGVRIDLTIVQSDYLIAHWAKDSQTIRLLDKDSCMPALPPPSDASYHVQKPIKTVYDGCCNEFWWCLNNVAKSIARDELSAAMHMYYEQVHTMLERMTEWYIGSSHEYKVSVGKFGKYFKNFLTGAQYKEYLHTYAAADFDHLWKAVFTACGLFSSFARSVALQCGFTYNFQDEQNMLSYLSSVKASAKSAARF